MKKSNKKLMLYGLVVAVALIVYVGNPLQTAGLATKAMAEGSGCSGSYMEQRLTSCSGDKMIYESHSCGLDDKIGPWVPNTLSCTEKMGFVTVCDVTNVGRVFVNWPGGLIAKSCKCVPDAPCTGSEGVGKQVCGENWMTCSAGGSVNVAQNTLLTTTTTTLAPFTTAPPSSGTLPWTSMAIGAAALVIIVIAMRKNKR